VKFDVVGHVGDMGKSFSSVEIGCPMNMMCIAFTVQGGFMDKQANATCRGAVMAKGAISTYVCMTNTQATYLNVR